MICCILGRPVRAACRRRPPLWTDGAAILAVAGSGVTPHPPEGCHAAPANGLVVFHGLGAHPCCLVDDAAGH